MRKISIIFIISVLLTSLLSSCSPGDKKSTYPLQHGTYCFEKAIITNKISNKIEEKSFDEILSNTDDKKEWHNLFSFQININNETEYFYSNNNRCFALNEGLAFEIIKDNTLQLHFPYWQDYNYSVYDVVIILTWQKVYG